MPESEEPIPEQAREAEPGNVPRDDELLSDEERTSKAQMPDDPDELPASDADRDPPVKSEPGENELGFGSSQGSPREGQGGL